MTASPRPIDMPGSHDEIAAEQAVIDHAYRRLEAMREDALAVAAGVLGQSEGGTHQARLERDVRVHVTRRRLNELQVGDAPLCFGRTDDDHGERLYIGRLAVSDEHNDALVVDWRAPAAEPFYRATGREPMGLTRRRHFILRGRRLVGIDDELLSREVPEGDGLVLMGEGALLAALERTRTGRMGDIVATIQREQDEVVRSPLPGILVVEGGPGSGKTAVALHRAAYLLYTHRFPLERAGVLLVGPNRVFLRYIEGVLPALGEHTVVFATPAGLRPSVAVTGADSPATARVKGDARMAEVLRRAVDQRQRPLTEALTVPYGRHLLNLSVADSARLVGRARRRGSTHNERRATLERLVVRHLLGQLAARGAPVGDEARTDAEEAVRDEPAFAAAVDSMWPRLTPEAFLRTLLGSRELLGHAAAGILAPDEIGALHRPERGWTDADVALLDEAAVLLGPLPEPRRLGGDADEAEGWMVDGALDDAGPMDPALRGELRRRLLSEGGGDELTVPELESRTFGHLVVDEAQDLSPMQWRMLGRRCPGGSMTLVGDLGQATGPWAPASWDEVVAHLPHRREPRRAVLTVNYRTPAEVMEVAARVLADAAPGVTPPVAVRRSGVGPMFTPVDPDDLVGATAQAARHEAAAVAPGKVGVVAPADLLAPVAAALGPELAGGGGADVLDAPVAVLSPPTAKGLEFDSVVVVEPRRLAAESPQGLRALYVALTRTTRRLQVVHADDLPASLAAFADPFPAPDPVG